MMMKTEQSLEKSSGVMPLKGIETLERLSVSYSKKVAGVPGFAVDRAVQRVVEIALKNAKDQRRAV
jgi:hypothetical protein